MEKDTVVLSLKDYNELREFKEKINHNYVIEVKLSNCSCYRVREFITKDEAIKTLGDINKQLAEEHKTYDAVYRELKNTEYRVKKQEEQLEFLKDAVDEKYRVKKMSIWEFIKWRKQK